MNDNELVPVYVPTPWVEDVLEFMSSKIKEKQVHELDDFMTLVKTGKIPAGIPAGVSASGNTSKRSYTKRGTGGKNSKGEKNIRFTNLDNLMADCLKTATKPLTSPQMAEILAPKYGISLSSNHPRTLKELKRLKSSVSSVAKQQIDSGRFERVKEGTEFIYTLKNT